MSLSTIGSDLQRKNAVLKENNHPDIERISELAVDIFSCSAPHVQWGRFTRSTIYEALTQVEPGMWPIRVEARLQEMIEEHQEIFGTIQAFVTTLDAEYKQRGKMEFSPLLPSGKWSHLTLRLTDGSQGQTIPIGDNTPCNRIVVDISNHTYWVFGSLGKSFEVVKLSMNWKLTVL